METMITSFIFVLTTFAFCATVTTAFTSETAINLPATSLAMIGGRGWDNQDYLSSLSGDDEDRAKSQEDYKDFSERRAAFHARQEEIMKTPQGQAFLKQRQEQEFQNLQEQQNQFSEDGLPFQQEFEQGSGGGTRMSQMMAQAKRMQGRRGMGGGNPMIGGFQQQLLGPLDDDGEEEEQ